MKRYLTGILLCALVGTASNAMARELSTKEKGIIAAKITAQLKDPDSAKITWEDYKGGEGYCAHVNAKNSYGGYSGNALVIASVKTDTAGNIISADAWVHSGDTENMMKPICLKAGYFE